MSVVPINDVLRTYDCKVQGCTGEARTNRGRFALLCERHARERQVRPAASAPPRGAGFEMRARALVAAGRQLDHAITRHQSSRAGLDEAMEAWEEAKRGLAGPRPGGE